MSYAETSVGYLARSLEERSYVGARAAPPGIEQGNTPRYSFASSFSQSPSASYSHGVPNGNPKLYAHTSSVHLAQAVKAHYDKSTGTGLPKPYVPSSARGAYLSSPTPHSLFIANDFLAPNSTARFVGSAEDVKEFVEEACTATTGEQLPNDIQITVLNDTEFTKAHLDFDNTTNDGVQGFSLNANGQGVNRIFVRANPLDRLMLTVGHEIGHVLTPTLNNVHDEEAKAFAFSLAWMDAVRERNIAGIGANILPDPAHNGLHDRAFAFVQRLMHDGATAWDAFLHLAKGAFTITNQIETVEVS